ncbi:hypothetical protein BJ508DRAFT_50944 [Ascobolus immersus RN42]|uniref:Uncharacterized protein n=1 Tax=Ascobolus immersus RN42 TaxID=1160509 RepID=A0A3N4IQC4_ASCIM|nr:hypothetical protein BJ508DRAFT_50944 [Ascobolus immersus RN42]
MSGLPLLSGASRHIEGLWKGKKHTSSRRSERFFHSPTTLYTCTYRLPPEFCTSDLWRFFSTMDGTALVERQLEGEIVKMQRNIEDMLFRHVSNRMGLLISLGTYFEGLDEEDLPAALEKNHDSLQATKLSLECSPNDIGGDIGKVILRSVEKCLLRANQLQAFLSLVKQLHHDLRTCFEVEASALLALTSNYSDEGLDKNPHLDGWFSTKRLAVTFGEISTGKKSLTQLKSFTQLIELADVAAHESVDTMNNWPEEHKEEVQPFKYMFEQRSAVEEARNALKVVSKRLDVIAEILKAGRFKSMVKQLKDMEEEVASWKRLSLFDGLEKALEVDSSDLIDLNPL